MERLKLSAEVRSTGKKSETKALRHAGFLPGTVYGRSLENPITVKVVFDEFKACLRTEAGANAVIDLVIQDNGKPQTVTVVLQTIQFDPVSRKALHVDFHAVTGSEKVTATVPVHIIGEAAGVKLGGHLEVVHHQLPVLAVAGTVPAFIDIDVTNLETGDSVKIGDITIENAEILGSPEDMVVVIRAPRAVTAEETAAAEEAAAPATPEGEAAPE